MLKTILKIKDRVKKKDIMEYNGVSGAMGKGVIAKDVCVILC